MKKILLTLAFATISVALLAQNIAITDDDGYTPENSAMLDVMSTTKGMLVPRVTADQRIAILNPADGLLVFDIDSVSFYFYSGSAWVNLTSANPSGIWAKNSNNVFLSDTTSKLGIGTNSPSGKFIVQADNSIGVEDPLFEVKDKDGQTVFAVHNDGIRVYVDENAKGNIGGFAVSGRSVTKDIKDYMWVTKDSIRMYLDDAGKGNIGGFAVSGRSVTKGSYDEYLRVTPDSTRVWVKKGAKGNIGGFAVSGRSVTKGIEEPIFVSTFDSTRVYVDQSTKGNIGGFAVSGRSVTKGATNAFLSLTPENYLIGHRAGDSITTGTKNFYAGYEAGMGTKTGFYNVAIGYKAGRLNNSASNVFIGPEAGTSNVGGWSNVFIGDLAGYSNFGGGGTLGARNIFIGREAGYANYDGGDNVYLGTFAGTDITSGDDNVIIGTTAAAHTNAAQKNVYIGTRAAYSNNGSRNVVIGNVAGSNSEIYSSNSSYTNSVMLGYAAGYNNVTGDRNIFIGYQAGYDEVGSNKLYIANTSTENPLIYGDFDNDFLKFNANVGINADPTVNYQLYVAENTTTSDRPAIYATHDVTDNYGVAIRGRSRYRAIWGEAITASGTGYGIYGRATGAGTGTRYGVYGYASGGTTTWAGYFSGNVRVTGTFNNSKATMTIDHPLDPENKYLVHSSVESPDMKNIYDGVVTLDNNGKAKVELPMYFGVLNKDFRYQLTAIGKPAPSIYIEKEIENDLFIIAGGEPGAKISWQVTGIRKDPYAEKNRIVVEQEKNSEEKGKYLHPELYGKTKEYSVDYDPKQNK